VVSLWFLYRLLRIAVCASLLAASSLLSAAAGLKFWLLVADVHCWHFDRPLTVLRLAIFSVNSKHVVELLEIIHLSPDTFISAPFDTHFV
jgi:hypothetical protein